MKFVQLFFSQQVELFLKKNAILRKEWSQPFCKRLLIYISGIFLLLNVLLLELQAQFKVESAFR